MPRTLSSLALAGCLLLVSGCASTQKKQQKAAKAEAVEQQAIAQAPTPEQKLGVLVEKYPQLLKQTTRVIHKTDTVVIRETAAAAVLPAVSTPATDTAFVKSLLAQLAAAGQQVNQAQANAVQRALLPELHSRPQLSKDTSRTVRDGLEIRAWVDSTGTVQIRARKLAQAVPYPSLIYDVSPTPIVYKKAHWYTTAFTYVKAYFWLVVLVALAILYLFIRSITRK